MTQVPQAREKSFFHGLFFSPPFKLLPALVWIYFVFAFTFHPGSQIWQYNLVTNDDYLYLTQTLDWIQGQPLLDRIQHRIDPPYGTLSYYSPFLIFIYGCLTLLLSHFMSTLNALFVMSAFYAVFYYAVFLKVMIWALKDIVGKEWANFSALISLFCLSLMVLYMPGQVDHHGLNAITIVASFGALSRMMKDPKHKRWPLLAGFLLAFGLAIALETIPTFITMVGFVGIWSALNGREAAKAAVLLAATLFICSVLFLVLSWPLGDLLKVDVGSYSIVYVGLCFGILLNFICIYFFSTLRPALRRMASAVGVVIIGTIFLIIFPDLRAGPFGGSNALVVKAVLSHSGEAQPMLKGGTFARAFFLPILAIIFQIYYLARRPLGMEPANILLLALITVLFCMAVFLQQRLAFFAEALCLIPLTHFMKCTWDRTDKMRDALMRRSLRLCTFLLIGPLTTVIIPINGFTDTNANFLDFALFPVQVRDKVCDQKGLTHILNTTYGDHPRVIMNTMGQSMEIILRTPHSVLASPYHTNTGGNLDALAFFTSTDNTEAHELAQKRNIDLIVTCTMMDALYIDPVKEGVISSLEAGQKTLAQRLLNGDPPNWLKQVNDPVLGNMLLFVVNK